MTNGLAVVTAQVIMDRARKREIHALVLHPSETGHVLYEQMNAMRFHLPNMD